MKKLKPCWRWFGPGDPIALREIRQTGARGIVTALHHIPNGAVWEEPEIQARKREIEAAGLEWTVVESLPVSEAIKQQTGDWRAHLDNYCESLQLLGRNGIRTVTYNFMPVLDWTRTDLDYQLPDHHAALRFEKAALAAFEYRLFKREIPAAEAASADAFFDRLSETQKEQLTSNIIAGLPGAEAAYRLSDFGEALAAYQHIDARKLRDHLIQFLETVTPAAEAAGVRLVIHPDDPPYPILGLPRVVSTAEDLRLLFRAVDSPANGLCFCTGSFGVRPDNDLPAMVAEFAERIHFVHLRNIRRDDAGNFFEANHLDGDVDMPAVMTALLREQQSRSEELPMRPDHGHRLLDDFHRKTNPGYTLIGRLTGLAELRGLEAGLLQQLTN